MLKWIPKTVVILAILLIAFRTADRVARRTVSLPVPPAPNGYELALAIARDLPPLPADLSELDSTAIRSLAEGQAPAAKKLHEAVRLPWGVPLKAGTAWMESHREEVRKLKSLAGLLALQSRLEMETGHTNASAGWMLDLVLLGQQMSQGGLLFDAISGMAVEVVGGATLGSRIPGLTAEFCRSAAQELEASEARRPTVDQIILRERDWVFASYGLPGKITGFFLRSSPETQRTEYERRSREIVRRTHRLILRLAKRAVELETGKPVVRSSDVVPSVLRQIPAHAEESGEEPAKGI